MSTDSDEDIQEEERSIKAETIEEEVIKPISIFINNVNSYQGQAIVRLLPLANNTNVNPSYDIYGTVKDFEIPQNVNIRSLISGTLNPSSCHFVDQVINNDVIVYDIGSDNTQIEEAQKVLHGLEKFYNKIKGDESKKDIIKYFILISTPMTWAKTPPLEEEESDVFTEEHYRKRRNHVCYVKHKCLEREVVNLQKRCKPNIRTVVVCPGFTYGEANDIFHYIFKLAFYNKEMIPVFKPGTNYVPLLYINDFGRMIKQLIDNFPEPAKRYILAVQPKLMTMKTFARNIVFNLAGNVTKIKLVSPHEVLQTYEEIIPV